MLENKTQKDILYTSNTNPLILIIDVKDNAKSANVKNMIIDDGSLNFGLSLIKI